MPSRKQRRRRQKSFRHEYVWQDESGNAAERLVELKPEVRKEKPAKAAGTAKGKATARGRRPGREVQPPSWRRVGKRTAIFAPLMFVAVSLLDHTQGAAAHVLQTAVLLAFFLPFSYVMDSIAYRMYVRRTGEVRQPQAPPKQAPPPKDRQAPTR